MPSFRHWIVLVLNLCDVYFFAMRENNFTDSSNRWWCMGWMIITLAALSTFSRAFNESYARRSIFFSLCLLHFYSVWLGIHLQTKNYSSQVHTKPLWLSLTIKPFIANVQTQKYTRTMRAKRKKANRQMKIATEMRELIFPSPIIESASSTTV